MGFTRRDGDPEAEAAGAQMFPYTYHGLVLHYAQCSTLYAPFVFRTRKRATVTSLALAYSSGCNIMPIRRKTQPFNRITRPVAWNRPGGAVFSYPSVLIRLNLCPGKWMAMKRDEIELLKDPFPPHNLPNRWTKIAQTGEVSNGNTRHI